MIPKNLLNEILEDDYYKKCIRAREGTCGGRITYEHALIFASKQVQQKFAILPLCEKHHDVLSYQDRGDLNKEINVLVALNRASDLEISSISRAVDYKRLRYHYRLKYPEYAREGVRNTEGYS